MIVVDVESSGVEPHKHSILSIGAVDFLDRSRVFYDECRIWEGAHVMDEALEVNGFKEEEITSEYKKTEAEIVEAFVAWALDSKEHTLAGHNPAFDLYFLKAAAERAKIDWPFPHRSYDSHSMCYMHMVNRGVEPPVNKKRSALNLDGVMQYVGLLGEPKPHNALTGARSACECFSRLLNDEKMLDEFQQFEIPWKT